MFDQKRKMVTELQDDLDAVCFMIMLVQWIIWSMLSVMMLDDHDAV